MRIPVKQIAVALAVLAATGGIGAGVATSGACTGGDAAFTGKYRLTGLLGVGSDIALKSDGSFQYALTYGALKQRGTGCWLQNGKTITLLPEGEDAVADVQTLGNTDFRGLELAARDDGALVWDIADSGRKAVYRKR